MYYVYVLTNKHGNVMYIGVTNNLARRVHEHKSKHVEGFTKVYNVDKLVYYEEYSNIRDAIAREKQLKGWRRSRKDALVASVNPEWNELRVPW
ncbi:MAG: GIY-YIG nuclease family protein [Ruminococcaceae bacterium]|nr:GIY-YIG nuclease family protein [Oscillospiraceae bacterium]